MKYSMLFLMMSVFIISCETESKETYYKFNASDKEFIPSVYKDVGNEFTFRNEINEEIKIEVISYDYSTEKGGGIGSSKPYHTYDVLEIELKTSDSELGCDFKKISITKWGGHLITRFNTRALSDPCEGFVAGEKLEFPYEVMSMNINNTNYDKVVSLFIDDQPYFSRDHIFNIVYYDFKQGIIGFDGNGNNSKYRLVKE